MNGRASSNDTEVTINNVLVSFLSLLLHHGAEEILRN